MSDAEQIGPVSVEVGSLIVRMALALNDEGIGPVNPQEADSAILAEAARVAIGVAEVTEHDLWDAGLVDAEQHDRSACERCIVLLSPPVEPSRPPRSRWRGVLVREGVETRDGRLVERGSTKWNLPPLSLWNPIGGGGQVGSIDEIWRDGNDVWALGTGPEGDDWRPAADVTSAHFRPMTSNQHVMIMFDITLVGATVAPLASAPWPDAPFEILADEPVR